MEDYRRYYEDDTFLKRVGLVERRQTYDYRRWLFHLYGLPVRGRWLDLGCGDGRDIEEFAPYVDEAVGVDFSDVNIAAAKKRLGTNNRVMLIKAAVDEFETEETFAIISCNFSFYYFDAEETVKKMKFWLNASGPGAVFIAGSPDENNIEFNEMVSRLLIKPPEVYRSGFSDVRKYESLFKRYFVDVQFYRLLNPIVFKDKFEFGQYIKSTTVWQSLSRSAQDEFFRRCSRKLREMERPVLTKVVDVLRASQGRVWYPYSIKKQGDPL